MESGSDLLVEPGLGQEIAGQLFESELIERLVAVKGLDHLIAPEMHLAKPIEVIAAGIGVTRLIQPRQGQPFRAMRRRQRIVRQHEDEDIGLPNEPLQLVRVFGAWFKTPVAADLNSSRLELRLQIGDLHLIAVRIVLDSLFGRKNVVREPGALHQQACLRIGHGRNLALAVTRPAGRCRAPAACRTSGRAPGPSSRAIGDSFPPGPDTPRAIAR